MLTCSPTRSPTRSPHANPHYAHTHTLTHTLRRRLAPLRARPPPPPPPPPPVNTGHFVLLPTPASLAFAYKWNFSAPGMARRTFSEQYGVRNLLARGRLAHCASLCSCFNETYRVRRAGLGACVCMYACVCVCVCV